MSNLGANPEQLAALAVTLSRQSQVIEELTAVVRNQLANTTWQGPAAERFRSSWGGEFEPSLRRLQAALQEAGVEVTRRREALLQAGR